MKNDGLSKEDAKLQRKKEKNAENERLQQKYLSLLEKIVKLGKAERYRYLRKQPEFESFRDDMLECCGVSLDGSELERKFEKGLEVEEDYGISGRKKGSPSYTVGGLEGMEAFCEAVRTYNIEKGTFASWMYSCSWHLVRNAWKENEDPFWIAAKEAAKINEIREEASALATNQNTEITDNRKEKKHKKPFVPVTRVYIDDVGRPNQDGSDEDGSDQNWPDKLKDPSINKWKNEQENEEASIRFFEILRLFEPLLILTEQTSRRQMTEVDRKLILRSYLTRELLKELKLVELDTEEKGLAESDGGTVKTGAPHGIRRSLYEKLRVGNKDYYKWISPAGKDYPAGNPEIYELLSVEEDAIMRIFQREYCQAAIQEDPEDLGRLYGIYFNLLKEGFSFADSYNPRIFNNNNLSTFSKWMNDARRFIRYYEEDIQDGNVTSDRINELYEKYKKKA